MSHTETGTTCTINRLFGLNGRERLWVDINHAIDEANDVAAWGDMPKPPPVEEWDVYPPAYHLPDAEWAAEFAAEHACGTDMTEDGGDEWWELLDAIRKGMAAVWCSVEGGQLVMHVNPRGERE